MTPQTQMTPTQARVLDLLEDDACFLDGPEFDAAILGVAERYDMPPVVCYDRTRVIDILARDMPRQDAEEFFEFNTLGAWLGETTPVFVDKRVAD